MKKNFNKTFNYLLISGLLIAILIWTFAFNLIYADERGGAKLVFIDVGQGDSALINLPNSVQILIDTGENKEVLEKIEKNMPLYDRKIEYLVLSHADSDHVGMASEIMQSFSVDRVIVGPSTSDSQTYEEIERTINDEKIIKEQVGAGDEICVVTNACMDFYSPDKNSSYGTTNEQSLVFRFSYNGADIMFTGDAEKDIQEVISAKYSGEELASEVLKVAHHGSRNAINDNFLKGVNPKEAIVSVGKNSYGHPVQETLDSLISSGIRVLRTDQEGDIKFIFENGSLLRAD